MSFFGGYFICFLHTGAIDITKLIQQLFLTEIFPTYQIDFAECLEIDDGNDFQASASFLGNTGGVGND